MFSPEPDPATFSTAVRNTATGYLYPVRFPSRSQADAFLSTALEVAEQSVGEPFLPEYNRDGSPYAVRVPFQGRTLRVSFPVTPSLLPVPPADADALADLIIAAMVSDQLRSLATALEGR